VGGGVSERSATATHTSSTTTTQRGRRRRVPYTSAEERSLRDGVAQYGTAWTTILRHYAFHAQRTAADLKEKYRRLTKVKLKVAQYSIAERRVPELIPVLCSQPASDVSRKPGEISTLEERTNERLTALSPGLPV